LYQKQYSTSIILLQDAEPPVLYQQLLVVTGVEEKRHATDIVGSGDFISQ
jgi:hypothetical protein